MQLSKEAKGIKMQLLLDMIIIMISSLLDSFLFRLCDSPNYCIALLMSLAFLDVSNFAVNLWLVIVDLLPVKNK